MKPSEPPIPVAIRGFLRGVLVFELKLENLPPGDSWLEMARGHAKAMNAGLITMIEVEFLDKPDDPHRFARFGMEPRGMTNPIAVNLKDLKKDPRAN